MAIRRPWAASNVSPAPMAAVVIGGCFIVCATFVPAAPTPDSCPSCPESWACSSCSCSRPRPCCWRSPDAAPLRAPRDPPPPPPPLRPESGFCFWFLDCPCGRERPCPCDLPVVFSAMVKPPAKKLRVEAQAPLHSLSPSRRGPGSTPARLPARGGFLFLAGLASGFVVRLSFLAFARRAGLKEPRGRKAGQEHAADHHAGVAACHLARVLKHLCQVALLEITGKPLHRVRRRVRVFGQALGLDRPKGVGGLVDRLAVARHLRRRLALLLVEQTFGFFFDRTGNCPCHFGSPFFDAPRRGARALADRPSHLAGASFQLF